MRALLVVMCMGGAAVADVRPDDAVMEVSAEYMHSPIHFENETGAVVANAVHFEDRNGFFAREVWRFLNPPPPVATPSAEEWVVTDSRQYTYYGPRRTITYSSVSAESRPRTKEQIKAIVSESVAARRKALSMRSFHTEVLAYTQTTDGANARGGSFNMRATVYGNDRFSIELGAGYGELRTDVCPPTDMLKCKYRFWGIPARVNVSLGRIGGIELAYDYNFDRVGLGQRYGTAWDPVRLGVTLNPIDRIFVRAKVFASPNEMRNPGWGLAVGGRL